MMAGSLACSVLHITGRLMILPIIIASLGAQVDLTSLVLWPLVLLYGGALIPAPAGGGAMEFGFSAIMQDVLPPDTMAASLIWWRFYSYYVYVLLGAFAAGRTAMRALNQRPRSGPSCAPARRLAGLTCRSLGVDRHRYFNCRNYESPRIARMTADKRRQEPEVIRASFVSSAATDVMAVDVPR
jgi:hypothetical protein